MKRFFRATSDGSSIGLVLAGTEDKSVAVVVHPKFWGPGPTCHRLRLEIDGKFGCVAVGESDVVECDAEVADLLLRPRGVTSIGGQPTSSLLAPIREPPTYEDEVLAVRPIEVAVALERLVRNVGIGSFLVDPSGGIGLHSRHRFLRPILYRMFVDEVERRIGVVRRKYVWAEERATVIRGQPDARSLILHTETGWPMITCRFEDFNFSVPHVMAICTALETIANDRSVANPPFDVVGSLRENAISLRRHLDEVPALPREEALAAAGMALRAGQLGGLTQALNLAVAVLEPRDGLIFGSAGQSVEIAVNSARLWELIVHRVLTEAGWVVLDGSTSGAPLARVDTPWRGLGGGAARPDFVVRRGDRRWILDAKYKVLEAVPAVADLYQMFAYSHLVEPTSTSSSEAIGLIYPTRTERSPRRLGPHERSGTVGAHLMLLEAEFPTMGLDGSKWRRYLRDEADRLGTHLAR